jgi:hypothetical protein
MEHNMKTINFVLSLLLLIFIIAPINPYAQSVCEDEKNVYDNVKNKKFTAEQKIKLGKLKTELTELKREYVKMQRALRSELMEQMLKDSLSFENIDKKNSELSKIYVKYNSKLIDYLFELKGVR